MSKLALVALFLLLSSLSALAKPPQHIYPVPCDQLWAAVSETLHNPSDFSILSMNDEAWKASFVVTGKLTYLTDHVSLTTADKGCAMTAIIVEIGSDDPDWRMFRNRLVKNLARMQAAKKVEPEKTAAE